MKYSISVLCLNNIGLTRVCLNSVLAYSGENYELLITNNGSTDGTKAMLDKLAAENPRVRVFHNETNEGFITPNRKRLEDAKGDLFVLLNNDATVPPGWLETLERPFHQFPNCALTGPHGGCSMLDASFHGKPGEKLEYLEGALVMGNTAQLREMGLFSPELEGAYGEDSDLSLRMRERGFTIHRVELKITHQRGATSAMVPQARGWQDKNHAWLRKRWAHYLKVRKFEYPILIKRAGAWGDVLLVTPLISELKRLRPLSPIWVETDCMEVFRNHPQVARCDRKIPITHDTLVIDLNMAYENRTQIHIVDAYADAANIRRGSAVTRLFPDGNDYAWADNAIKGDGWIAVHPGPTTWRGKNWQMERFKALIAELIQAGWKIVIVGKGSPGFEHTINLAEQTTVHQLAAVLHNCRCFVGVDSFPLHIAQAMGIPVVGLFGITDPKFILTESSPSIGVCGTAPTFGQRHRESGKRVVDDGGLAINSIEVQAVLKAVSQLIAETVAEGVA